MVAGDVIVDIIVRERCCATMEDLLLAAQVECLKTKCFNSVKQTSKLVLNKVEPVHFLLELVRIG